MLRQCARVAQQPRRAKRVKSSSIVLVLTAALAASLVSARPADCQDGDEDIEDSSGASLRVQLPYGQSLLQMPEVVLLQLPMQQGRGQRRTADIVDTTAASVPEEMLSGASWGSGLDEDETAAGASAGGAGAAFLGLVWHRWSPPPKLRQDGFWEFFLSANLFYWCVFGVAVGTAMLLRVILANIVRCPSTLAGNALTLLAWLAIALVYLATIWTNLGRRSGIDWLAGYVLEIVFMVENIFIFSMVIGAFKLPPALVPRALLCVVVGQILFELVFFMGLAAWLRSFTFLPYMLGIWLTGCGLSAFFGGHDHAVSDPTEAPDTPRSPTVRRIRSLRTMLVAEDAPEGEMGLLVLAVCTLLIADFFLEIDIVLMKIEEFPNSYISFSSSALAAMALPELFFVGEFMLQRFSLLKYGIAFVLIIFGIEMLASSFLKYELSPAVACFLVGVVLFASVVLSAGHEAIHNLQTKART